MIFLRNYFIFIIFLAARVSECSTFNSTDTTTNNTTSRNIDDGHTDNNKPLTTTSCFLRNGNIVCSMIPRERLINKGYNLRFKHINETLKPSARAIRYYETAAEYLIIWTVLSFFIILICLCTYPLYYRLTHKQNDIELEMISTRP